MARRPPEHLSKQRLPVSSDLLNSFTFAVAIQERKPQMLLEIPRQLPLDQGIRRVGDRNLVFHSVLEGHPSGERSIPLLPLADLNRGHDRSRRNRTTTTRSPSPIVVSTNSNYISSRASNAPTTTIDNRQDRVTWSVVPLGAPDSDGEIGPAVGKAKASGRGSTMDEPVMQRKNQRERVVVDRWLAEGQWGA